MNISPELEQLEKILHFPEEVALALAEVEAQLFCQVRSVLDTVSLFDSVVEFLLFSCSCKLQLIYIATFLLCE